MEPYFLWNGRDSRTMGVVVTSYPPIIRAPERVMQHIIPGRAGVLITTEGKHVFDAYVKSFVIGLRPGIDVQPVVRWLQGEGTAVFGNDPYYAYHGRILSAVQFDKIGTWAMKSAGVQLLCQPFKTRATPDPAFSITTQSYGIYNPGDVESAPLLSLTHTGALTLAVGDTSMAFSALSGEISIDCDAGVILDGQGNLFEGSWGGEFLKIPPGNSTFTVSASGVSVSVLPRWRWQ